MTAPEVIVGDDEFAALGLHARLLAELDGIALLQEVLVILALAVQADGGEVPAHLQYRLPVAHSLGDHLVW